MSEPHVIVCTGGGGVGKTTASAALALAFAKSGRRALIVSIDPARRLADAIGVELGTEAREVSVDVGSGRLFGLMPDPGRAMRTFVEILFEEEPEALARLLENQLYRVLEQAVPGIHELAATILTWRAIIEHEIDIVVIDTAPSRNAVDFVNYPRRLAKLLGGRAVGWLATIATRGGPSQKDEKMSRVERLLVRVLGPAVTEVAGLFGELARVRKRFVWLNERTAELLLGPRTRYFLVAAPTGAAEDDIEYLMKRLGKLEIEPAMLLINSAFVPKRQWMTVLTKHEDTTPVIREVLTALAVEQQSREHATGRVSEAFVRRHPTVAQLRLPFVEAIEPRHVVEALAACFEAQTLDEI